MDIGLVLDIAVAAAKFLALVAVGVLVYLLSRIHHLRERKRLETARPMPADAGSSMPKAAPDLRSVQMGDSATKVEIAAPAAPRPLPAGPMPLDDVAGRLLVVYPGQVDVLLKFLGWVGIVGAAMVSVITVVLGMLPGALRLWAAAAPDPEEDHTLWDFNPHMSTYSDDSMPWTSSSQIVDSLDRETR